MSRFICLRVEFSSPSLYFPNYATFNLPLILITHPMFPSLPLKITVKTAVPLPPSNVSHQNFYSVKPHLR